jgi:hypothetical protein
MLLRCVDPSSYPEPSVDHQFKTPVPLLSGCFVLSNSAMLMHLLVQLV